MKLRELESELQGVEGFAAPKRELEQYVTTPHLAARMLFTAAGYGDIDGKEVVDLGCGCGVLGIASIMLGAEHVTGVDADPDALEIARANIAEQEMESEVTLVHAQLVVPHTDAQLPGVPVLEPTALPHPDTIVMNPPFGTWRKGIDAAFLEAACLLTPHAIYSLHKSSTREYIVKKARSLGYTGEALAQMRYDLPRTMKFHKKDSVDIEVDLFRFERA